MLLRVRVLPGLCVGVVAEVADAPDLKSGWLSSVGSSPTGPMARFWVRLLIAGSGSIPRQISPLRKRGVCHSFTACSAAGSKRCVCRAASLYEVAWVSPFKSDAAHSGVARSNRGRGLGHLLWIFMIRPTPARRGGVFYNEAFYAFLVLGIAAFFFCIMLGF